MNNLKSVLFFIFLLTPLISFSQSEAVLRVGQKINVQSEVLNETRDVWVYLPPTYSDKYYAPQQYPVLYILDGDQHFHSVSGMIQILGAGINWSFAIPEMIVVAIPNTNRIRDLIPSHSLIGADGKEYADFNQSGGTDKFLTFITKELSPKIESAFRTLPYRILIGQSFGGLAVLHALCTSPNFFNAYVAIEPSLWWDDQLLLKQKRDYFTTANLTGKCLYLTQANSLRSWGKTNPHFEAIKEFSTLLETRNRSGLRWKYNYYPDDDHSTVAFISEYDALRFIFNKYHADFETITTAEQLKERYKLLSEEVGFTFPAPERVTQLFGNAYSGLGEFNTAYDFFQMNLDNYPNSSSAYATIGQYWKSRGDKKKALEYYEKSVKIFPENEDSNANIKSLKK